MIPPGLAAASWVIALVFAVLTSLASKWTDNSNGTEAAKIIVQKIMWVLNNYISRINEKSKVGDMK